MRQITKKRGFTIVELVIVIAVIAILAAVLIPTFSNLVKKSHISVDRQLVYHINEAVRIHEAENPKPKTAYEAIKATEELGFTIERLTPTTEGYDIVWDSLANRYALLDEKCNVVYEDPDKPYTAGITAWKLYGSMPSIEKQIEDGYSVYLKGTNKTGTINVVSGFDVGDNTGIELVNYNRDSSAAAQTIVIRTNTFGTKLTVDATNDTVIHYGFAGLVEVTKVAMSSYDEYGVVGRLSATADGASGHIDIKGGATVYQVEQLGGAATKVSVDANATVYDINHEKVQGAIVETTERFTDMAVVGFTVTETHSEYERITGKACVHEYSEDVIDGKHVYEVCKTCGYTVVKVGDNKKTVSTTNDENAENVIIPKATYGTGSNQVVSIDDNEVVLVADSSTETGYVQPEIETVLVIDPQNPIDTSCKHSFTYSDGDEKCVVTCSKCGLTYSQAHSYDGVFCEHCGHENRLAMNVTKNIMYYTFGEALAAADEGDEIKLLGNCAFTSKITIDKNLTINLNGKEMQFSQMNNAITVNAGKTLTINDPTNTGIIESIGTNASDYTYYNSTIYLTKGSKKSGVISPGATLVINGGEIINNGNYYGACTVYADSYTTLDINKGKVTSKSPDEQSYAIKTGGSTTTLTIDNAVISTYSENTSSSNINGAVYPTINNTVFNGYTCLTGAQGTVDNCVFNGKVGTSTSTTTLTISNSTIDGDFRNGTSTYQKGQLVNCTVNGEVYSSAGLISGDNSKFANQFDVSWLEAGKTLTSTKNLEGYYTLKAVSQEDCVATLMYDGLDAPLYFRSVTDALNEGKTDEHKASAVVTVIKDSSVASLSAYSINKVVINEGVTFTCTSISLSSSGVSEARCVFENNGTTIVNGSIAANVGQGYFVNNGDFTLNYFNIKTATNYNNGNILLSTGTTTIASNLVNNGTLKATNEDVILMVNLGKEVSGTGLNYAEGAYVWNVAQDKFVAAEGVVHNVQKNKDYYTLSDAITSATAGNTLKILKNISLGGGQVIQKNLMIDLNGYTLEFWNYTNIAGKGKALTIKSCTVIIDDSSANHDGKITATAGPAIWIQDDATLTLNNGIIENTGRGGSWSCVIFIAGYQNNNEVGATNAHLIVNGGKIVASSESWTDPMSSIYYSAGDGIYIFGHNDTTNMPSITINGGEVTANGTAIVGQGIYNNTQITIAGGKVESYGFAAIYHPQYGELNISGTAVVKGISAICLKGGTLTISGGTIEATKTGAYAAPASAQGSGTNITGDALYIEDNYNRGIVVNITGGTFTTQASGAQEYRVLFSGETPAVVNDNR